MSRKEVILLSQSNRTAGLYNCHTHSHFSHDSRCNPLSSATAALESGLSGFAITDHCDVEDRNIPGGKDKILSSAQCAAELNREFGDRLSVMSGVEMGEAIWCPEYASDIIASAEYDIVLGSVHAVRYKNFTDPYSQINFSLLSNKETDDYLSAYFFDMAEMIQTCDFDVLSHLTCPLRYITGKYGKSVDLERHYGAIEEILKAIISKNIALEVNSSCLGPGYDKLMPDIPILEKYAAYGGRLVTVGSDAHTADRVSFGLDTAALAVKNAGFEHLYYYKNRTPVPYGFDTEAIK